MNLREVLIGMVIDRDNRPRFAAEELVDRWLNGTTKVHGSWPDRIHRIVMSARTA